MPTRTRSVTVAASVAIVLSPLTIVQGGSALFGGAGNDTVADLIALKGLPNG